MRPVVGTLLIVAACASSRGGAPPATPARPTAATTAARPAAPVAGLDDLATAVEGFPDRAALPRTLRELADVLTAIAHRDAAGGAAIAAHAARIRELADQLAAAPREPAAAAGEDASRAKLAIGEALVAVEALLGGELTPPLRAAYVDAVAAYERIAPGAPLAPQLHQAHDALASISDALAIVQGTAPRFTDRRGRVVARDRAALRREVGRAAEAVDALAHERDWARARAHATRALRALADAVAVAPSTLGDRDQAALATAVRFEATRLARARGFALRRCELIRAGLLAATAALDDLASPPAGSALAELAGGARRAATAIDREATLPFAQPQIQDGFRAVVAAYQVLAFARAPSAPGAR